MAHNRKQTAPPTHEQMQFIGASREARRHMERMPARSVSRRDRRAWLTRADELAVSVEPMREGSELKTHPGKSPCVYRHGYRPLRGRRVPVCSCGREQSGGLPRAAPRRRRRRVLQDTAATEADLVQRPPAKHNAATTPTIHYSGLQFKGRGNELDIEQFQRIAQARGHRQRWEQAGASEEASDNDDDDSNNTAGRGTARDDAGQNARAGGAA